MNTALPWFMTQQQFKLSKFQHVLHTHSVYQCPAKILLMNSEIIRTFQAFQADIWRKKILAVNKQIN